MNTNNLIDKSLRGEWLSIEEGMYLFEHAPLALLMFAGNEMRKRQKPDGKVTWIIDRNVNTTNVCTANCKFCNFYRIPGHAESYITTMDQYRVKIEELRRYGGEQLLLQGGHHPDLGIEFYEDLFKNLKSEFPDIKLHALGPPEIAHISKLSKLSHTEVLGRLKNAGLDSLPGAGAEILNDRVRRMISKGKCTGREWLDVMRAAHQLDLTTSATMMFGHIETLYERFEHLSWIRQVQSEKPESAKGFLAFIPWPFMDDGTLL
jgi:cyclic dehypoxanthinyl futalosine synthase